jgi:hypothetical protein
MSLLQDPSGRIRWIAIVAVAGLIAGLSAAWWYCRPPRPAPLASTPDAGTGVPDDAIHRGLRAAPDDSAAIKARWVDEVPGFDHPDLSASRREISCASPTPSAARAAAATRRSVRRLRPERGERRASGRCSTRYRGRITSTAGVRKPPG